MGILKSAGVSYLCETAQCSDDERVQNARGTSSFLREFWKVVYARALLLILYIPLKFDELFCFRRLNVSSPR